MCIFRGAETWILRSGVRHKLVKVAHHATERSYAWGFSDGLNPCNEVIPQKTKVARKIGKLKWRELVMSAGGLTADRADLLLSGGHPAVRCTDNLSKVALNARMRAARKTGRVIVVGGGLRPTLQ